MSEDKCDHRLWFLPESIGSRILDKFRPKKIRIIYCRDCEIIIDLVNLGDVKEEGKPMWGLCDDCKMERQGLFKKDEGGSGLG